jgi:hypothetical protein
MHESRQAHCQLPCSDTHPNPKKAFTQRVDFVAEKDDAALRRLAVVQQRLQPLLKLATICRPSNDRGNIQRNEAFASQPVVCVCARLGCGCGCGTRGV